MSKKSSKKSTVSTEMVLWQPSGKVQVFYVKKEYQTYRPTRNGNGALAMASHLLSRGIRSEIITAYVPDFLIAA